MNEPSVIQSQQTKWMEVILVCLGILIPIQFGPVVYQYLKWSNSTPDLICNGLGALLILVMCLSLLLKYQPLSQCILNSSPASSEISRQDSELSGWLTIGIFTFGLLLLVHTIPTMLFVLGERLSPLFMSIQEPPCITKDKLWLYLTVFCLEFFPQLAMALLFTYSPQSLTKLVIYLQSPPRPLKTESPLS